VQTFIVVASLVPPAVVPVRVGTAYERAISLGVTAAVHTKARIYFYNRFFVNVAIDIIKDVGLASTIIWRFFAIQWKCELVQCKINIPASVASVFICEASDVHRRNSVHRHI
jgi:hypothetical protein